MPSVPPDVYGPFGAVVILFLVVVVLVRAIQKLWEEHLRADQDDREQRDVALAGWRAQTDATKELTDAIKAATRPSPPVRRRT